MIISSYEISEISVLRCNFGFIVLLWFGVYWVRIMRMLISVINSISIFEWN